jgi:hypothetical protein
MNAVDRVLALGSQSWQAPENVESAGPQTIPAPPQEPPAVEPQIAAADRAGDVAFTMRLHPVVTGPPVKVETVASPPATDLGATPPPAPVNPTVWSHPTATVAAPVAGSKSPKQPHADDQSEPTRSQTHSIATARPLPHAALESPSQPECISTPSRFETPEPVRPIDVLPLEPPSEPKPAGAAHDIKLQVTGGPQRIEVRLTERAGEVQVAVRTPDSHLAGSLRENLPTLSARLAENGYRTEAWHPAAPNAEWRRSAETGNLTQDQNPQSGGQHHGQQSGDDPRRPKPPEAPMQRKEKGKEFEWLMSTLQ